MLAATRNAALAAIGSVFLPFVVLSLWLVLAREGQRLPAPYPEVLDRGFVILSIICGLVCWCRIPISKSVRLFVVPLYIFVFFPLIALHAFVRRSCFR